MKKIIIIHILLICIAAQSIFAEDWFEPKTLSDLAGNWESSFEIPITEGTIPGVPGSSIIIEITIDNTAPASKDPKVKFFVKFNLNKFMDDIITLPEIKAYGFTKDMLWAIMSQSFTEEINEAEITVGKYFFTISQIHDADEFFFDDTNQVLINKNKTKLLLVSDMDISQGLSDEGVYEVVFTKK